MSTTWYTLPNAPDPTSRTGTRERNERGVDWRQFGAELSTRVSVEDDREPACSCNRGRSRRVAKDILKGGQVPASVDGGGEWQQKTRGVHLVEELYGDC